MPRKTILFLIAFLLTAPISGHSQEKRIGRDLLNFRYLYNPPSTVSSSEIPDDFRISTQSYRFSGAIPYYVKDTKTVFINGLTYSLLRASFNEDYAGEIDPIDLHMLQYRINVVQMLPKKWNVAFLLTPTLASDFEGLSFRDLRANSGVLFGYRILDNMNAQLGVVYTSNFGEDLIIPTFGLQYGSEKLRVRIVAPAIAEFWYIPRDIIEIGLSARLEGGQYNIHGDSTDADYVKLSFGNAGPALRLYPYKGFYLQAWSGMTLYGKIETYKNNVRKYDFSPDPNWFASVALGYGY